MLHETGGRKFLEVGCGSGNVSRKLLEKGYTGTGIDFSPDAIELAKENLSRYTEEGLYNLVQADLSDDPEIGTGYDFALSFFVIEHVSDDLGFLEKLKARVRPGGWIFIAAPSRMDKWSVEDDTVGHLRRYERSDLFELVEKAGLVNPVVWSVAVPVSNILLGLSSFFIQRSCSEDKTALSTVEQTMRSGIKEIPFKTVFPKFFTLFINRFTMLPFFMLQRRFYDTGRGLSMLVRAQRPE